jgi:hypothetical protein
MQGCLKAKRSFPKQWLFLMRKRDAHYLRMTLCIVASDVTHLYQIDFKNSRRHRYVSAAPK